jgi:hypothetical protein
MAGQSPIAAADRHRGGRQAIQGRDPGPGDLVVTGDLLGVDIDLALVLRPKIVRKTAVGIGGHSTTSTSWNSASQRARNRPRRRLALIQSG